MNEKERLDKAWLTKIAVRLAMYCYVCTGLYWFYPEVLNMLFWPFHYGWLAH